MKRQIRRNGVAIYRNVKNLEAAGTHAVETVRFASNGSVRELDVDTLLLHNGVVPDCQITQQLECEHVWYEPQR